MTASGPIRRSVETGAQADDPHALDPHALDRLRGSIAKLERLLAEVEAPQKSRAEREGDGAGGS